MFIFIFFTWIVQSLAPSSQLSWVQQQKTFFQQKKVSFFKSQTDKKNAQISKAIEQISLIDNQSLSKPFYLFTLGEADREYEKAMMKQKEKEAHYLNEVRSVFCLIEDTLKRTPHLFLQSNIFMILSQLNINKNEDLTAFLVSMSSKEAKEIWKFFHLHQMEDSPDKLILNEGVFNYFEPFFVHCCSENPFLMMEFLKQHANHLPPYLFKRLVLLVNAYLKQTFFGNSILHFIAQIIPRRHIIELKEWMPLFEKSIIVFQEEGILYESLFNQFQISVFQMFCSSPYYLADIDTRNTYITGVIEYIKLLSNICENEEWALHVLHTKIDYTAMHPKKRKNEEGVLYFIFLYNIQLANQFSEKARIQILEHIVSTNSYLVLEETKNFFLDQSDLVKKNLENLVQLAYQQGCDVSLNFLKEVFSAPAVAIENSSEIVLKPSYISGYKLGSQDGLILPLHLFSTLTSRLEVPNTLNRFEIKTQLKDQFLKLSQSWLDQNQGGWIHAYDVFRFFNMIEQYVLSYNRLVYRSSPTSGRRYVDYLFPILHHSTAVRRLIAEPSFAYLIPFIMPSCYRLKNAHLALFNYKKEHMFFSPIGGLPIDYAQSLPYVKDGEHFPFLSLVINPISPLEITEKIDSLSDDEFVHLSLQEGWVKQHSSIILKNDETVLSRLFSLLSVTPLTLKIIERLEQDDVLISSVFLNGKSPLLLPNLRNKKGRFSKENLQMLKRLIIDLNISPVSVQEEDDYFFQVFIENYEQTDSHENFLNFLLRQNLVRYSSAYHRQYEMIPTERLIEKCRKKTPFLKEMIKKGVISVKRLEVFYTDGDYLRDVDLKRREYLILSSYCLTEAKALLIIDTLLQSFTAIMIKNSEVLWHIFDHETACDSKRRLMLMQDSSRLVKMICAPLKDTKTDTREIGEEVKKEERSTSVTLPTEVESMEEDSGIKRMVQKKIKPKKSEIAVPLPRSKAYVIVNDAQTGEPLNVETLSEEDYRRFERTRDGMISGRYEAMGKTLKEWFFTDDKEKVRIKIDMYPDEEALYTRLFSIFKAATEREFPPMLLMNAMKTAINQFLLYYSPFTFYQNEWVLDRESIKKHRDKDHYIVINTLKNMVTVMKAIFHPQYFRDFLHRCGLNMNQQFRNFFMFLNHFSKVKVAFKMASYFMESLFFIDIDYFLDYFLFLIKKDHSIDSYSFKKIAKWLDECIPDYQLRKLKSILKSKHPDVWMLGLFPSCPYQVDPQLEEAMEQESQEASQLESEPMEQEYVKENKGKTEDESMEIQQEEGKEVCLEGEGLVFRDCIESQEEDSTHSNLPFFSSYYSINERIKEGSFQSNEQEEEISLYVGPIQERSLQQGLFFQETSTAQYA